MEDSSPDLKTVRKSKDCKRAVSDSPLGLKKSSNSKIEM